jgi:hypothetical protein
MIYHLQTSAITRATSVRDQTNEKWSTVMSKNNNMKTRASNTLNMDHSYISTNWFAPLSNLHGSQPDEMEHMFKGKLPQTTHSPTTKTNSQHHFGLEYGY